MGNCCDCFGKNDGTGSYLHSPRDGSGGGQRLGTAAEHQQERQRRADQAAAARAAVQDEPERIFDPNLTDSERQRQRELRAQAVERRSQPKKPKAPASSQEFRNPNNDPNMLKWSV
ncbi:unnamed protein product [Ectocarpus sp. CCAP 1310/34]|nr:unnamed protein product [Ectocarpus sp. CCAP 1310/34]